MIIDNSIDIDKVVTWQYDNSEHLVGIVDFIKQFFLEAVGQVWDGRIEDLDLANGDVSDYALTIWGKLLGVRWPALVSTSVFKGSLDREAYRRILLAHFRFYAGDRTPAAMKTYCETINGGEGIESPFWYVDNMDMTVSFTFDGTPEEGDSTMEDIKFLVDNFNSFSDVIGVHPSGVGYGGDYDGKFFSISHGGSNTTDKISNFKPSEKGIFHW